MVATHSDDEIKIGIFGEIPVERASRCARVRDVDACATSDKRRTRSHARQRVRKKAAPTDVAQRYARAPWGVVLTKSVKHAMDPPPQPGAAAATVRAMLLPTVVPGVARRRERFTDPATGCARGGRAGGRRRPWDAAEESRDRYFYDPATGESRWAGSAADQARAALKVARPRDHRHSGASFSAAWNCDLPRCLLRSRRRWTRRRRPRRRRPSSSRW